MTFNPAMLVATIIHLIDDDIVHQFTTSKMIELCELNTKTSSFLNGKEALKHLASSVHSELPDIILLDINMPVMDGWQFLDEFAHIKPSLSKNINIFILSSSLDERDISRAKEYNEIIAYITKPVDTTIIANIINSKRAN